MSVDVAIKKNFKGFNLDVAFTNNGAKLGILGASGCGKSMTLNCIAGIIRPDSGRIVLNGRILFDSSRKIDLPPQQRRVGYLFQSYALFPHLPVVENIACGMGPTKYALFPHLPVVENIAFGLGLVKQDARRDERIREMIDLLHLEGLEERYPCQLSGGQQQRVALARILAYRPEIILLDEPFAALDEYLKEQLHLQLVEVLRHWGNNVILVTHNRDEVYKICDKLLVMDDGGPIGMGDTTALFAAPERVQIARLTGCKNISRAQKCGEYSVEALDWGLHFTTARPVGKEITAVGVRAHDFHPAKASDVNAIAVAVVDTNDSPFERNIIFRTAGDSPLWWKCPRETEDTPLPAFLAVAPESVLLLKE